MAHLPSIMASMGDHAKRQKIEEFFKRRAPGFGKGFVLATNVDTGELCYNPEHKAMHSEQPDQNPETPVPVVMVALDSMWFQSYGEADASYRERLMGIADEMVNSLRAVGCHAIACEHDCPDPLNAKSSMKQLCVALPETRLEMEGDETKVVSNLRSLPQFIAYFIYKGMVRPQQVQAEFGGKLLAEAINPEILEQFQGVGADLPSAKYHQQEAEKLFPKPCQPSV